MIKFIKNNTESLIIITLVSLLAICYLQQKQLSQYRKANITFVEGRDTVIAAATDSLQHLVDSLSYELFPKNVELGRYQVAFEIFAERNPKAAEQYAEIISSETK